MCEGYHMCVGHGLAVHREPTLMPERSIRNCNVLLNADPQCRLPILPKESTQAIGKVRVSMS